MKKIKFERHFIQKVPEVRTKKDWWLVIRVLIIWNTLIALILSSAIILWQRKQIDKLSQQTNEDRTFIEEVKKQYGNGVIQIMLKKGCEK